MAGMASRECASEWETESRSKSLQAEQPSFPLTQQLPVRMPMPIPMNMLHGPMETAVPAIVQAFTSPPTEDVRVEPELPPSHVHPLPSAPMCADQAMHHWAARGSTVPGSLLASPLHATSAATGCSLAISPPDEEQNEEGPLFCRAPAGADSFPLSSFHSLLPSRTNRLEHSVAEGLASPLISESYAHLFEAASPSRQSPSLPAVPLEGLTMPAAAFVDGLLNDDYLADHNLVATSQ